MIRAVFSDLDGTLLREDKTLSPLTKKTVAYLQETGVWFGFATGRPFAGVKDLMEELRMPEYDGVSVVNTGATLRQNRDGALVDGKFSPTAGIVDLYALAKDTGCILTGYSDVALYVVHSFDLPTEPSMEEVLRKSPAFAYESDVLKMPLHFCSTENLPQEVGRWNLLGEKEQVDKAWDICPPCLQEMYLRVRNEMFSMEMLHPGAGKEQRILSLLEAKGWKKEEILVLGDGNNDVSMLSAFPNSIAMANGTNRAKQAAHYLTSTNEEEGFFRGISQFFDLPKTLRQSIDN